ncbi:MAG TPA: YdiU family protein, partial [Polyangiaceae bacterium]|nr:YdiU family protein [Polyangiaceae bacterium]
MLRFDNTYARLPERLFARVAPTPVREPRLVKVNHALARLLGADLERLESPEGALVLSGNVVPDGAEPLAQAYAGHQFGGFVPRLGDGRAILLGEVVGTDGLRRDVQLKGSGRTPFSRRGDGRAAVGPVLREYVVSEAMAALGIPATRALAFVTTGEPVIRDGLLPGAVLTRVAASHLRIGTFQYFANNDDTEGLRLLTRYALARHYPDAERTGNDALALLERVLTAQARLVARWLGVGFVHGVMNTDNMTISGETIDFGPCAFLDEYDPKKTFSSIDTGGRYAFSNQPRIALWNLARLAEALLPLIADNVDDAVRLASTELDRFEGLFERAYGEVMRAKLGLLREEENDGALAEGVLSELAAHAADYTLFWSRLDAASEPSGESGLLSLFSGNQAPMRQWLERWRKRLALEPDGAAQRTALMRRANPTLIPRNHRIEEAIQAAVTRGDLEPFETLVLALATPGEARPEHAHLAEPPLPEQRVLQTFCG